MCTEFLQEVAAKGCGLLVAALAAHEASERVRQPSPVLLQFAVYACVLQLHLAALRTHSMHVRSKSKAMQGTFRPTVKHPSAAPHKTSSVCILLIARN
jgi:hypothetical protein